METKAVKNSGGATSVTQLLISYGKGDKEALERLLPLVYRELRRLAGGMMKREKPSHTLQPTALVHEAYFRLVDQKQAQLQNRAHFFAVSAQLMRRILIDHARAKKAAKRGGSKIQISFNDAIKFEDGKDPDLVSLDYALEKLTKLDERQGRVVELRYFGGLSIEETAKVLETSPATVKRDWKLAKAWLYRELSKGTCDGANA